MNYVLLATALVVIATPALAQNTGDDTLAAAPAPVSEDDGTDPTRLSTAADVTLEHLDLRNGFDLRTLAFGVSLPVGDTKRTSIRIRTPLVASGVSGNDSLGLGDVSLKVTRVLTVTRSYGVVAGGELVFDTASRAELGFGRTVLKASFIYAKFVQGGAIFAPALVHSISLAGRTNRPDINLTTLDFYYVPRLANRQLFMTVDPAVTYDWENDRSFAALAITFGLKTGKALGGASQVFVKPSVLIGSDRGANWGALVGFKVINF